MRPVQFLALSILIGTTAQAAVLPLRPGTYVLTNSSCDKPAFAAVFTYDGRQFAYPHATHCRSAIRSHAGKTYRVSETCTAAGDGSPVTPSKIETSYTISGGDHVTVWKHGEAAGSDYRQCSTPIEGAFR